MNNNKKLASGINEDLNNATAAIKKDFEKKGSKGGKRRPKRNKSNGRPTMSRSNPYSFYSKYSQYLDDASNLPTAAPLGVRFETLFKGPGTLPVSDENDFVVSGIMTLRFIPVPGVSADMSSAMNRSSIQAWTYMRSIMKASADYDHQDITIYTLAIDSAVAFHSLLKRVVGMLPDSTPLNRYYCKPIIEASGIDYQDLLGHISDFRAYVNQFAYDLAKFSIPNGIELINRHQWMSEGIYTDSPTTRAQTYMFVPYLFWKFDNTLPKGGGLTAMPWAGLHTFEEVRTFGNTLINAISNDEDFAFISGDMHALYAGNEMVLPYVNESYQILPKFDEVVLSQIENATIVGGVATGFANDQPYLAITQNPNVNEGAILFDAYTQTVLPYYGDVAMNFHKDRPSNQDIVEASRLIAVNTLDDPVTHAGTQWTKLLACGTELVVSADVYKYSPAQDKSVLALEVNQRKRQFSQQLVQENLDDQISIISTMCQFAQFDWAPRIELFQKYTGSEGEPVHIIGTTWDIDVITDIEPNHMKNLHDACLWSEFDYPSGARNHNR